MPQFSSKRRVPHSAQQMFDLVADVERYPRIRAAVQGAEDPRSATQQDDGTEVIVADMTVSFKLVQRNLHQPGHARPANLKILVEYLKGPFSNIENRWTFVPKARTRLRGRVLHRLRVQQPHAGDC